MSAPAWFATVAVGEVLVRLSLVLGFAWLAHGILRSRHPRWRWMLWRAALVALALVPLTLLFGAEIPRLAVPWGPVATPAHFASGFGGGQLSSGAEGTAATEASSVRGNASAATSHKVEVGSDGSRTRTTAAPSRFGASLRSVVGGIWLLGVVWGAAQWMRAQRQLVRLRRASLAAAPTWEQDLAEVCRRLEVRDVPRIRVATEVEAPCACGVWRPWILLPSAFREGLGSAERLALLAHEVAHVRHRDLAWCQAWAWATVLLWFHPLVWRIPRAHRLACELEADRVARAGVAREGDYAELLAGLCLELLALPRREDALRLSAASQLARRLEHLRSTGSFRWGRRERWLSGVLAAGVVFAGSGWRLTQGQAADPQGARGAAALPTFETQEVRVTVLDERGNPLAGAEIRPDGLRLRPPANASHYGWDPGRHGPRTPVTTDAKGEARVRYPKYVVREEKLRTGQISFSVVHPGYRISRPTEYAVDGSASPIRLELAARLEVTATFGPDAKPVEEFDAWLSGEGGGGEWQVVGPGVRGFAHAGAGERLLQVRGKLPDGALVFAVPQVLTMVPGSAPRVKVQLLPGRRIEGRLDERVARPVRDGRVQIAVRAPQLPTTAVPEEKADLYQRYGEFQVWRTHRPIAEDGTFVFESVPPGTVDVIAMGEGFVSSNGAPARNRIADGRGGVRFQPVVIGVPQSFPLDEPVTRLVVRTETPATLEVRTTTRAGEPIAGAQVVLSPNVMGPWGIFGDTSRSDERPYRTVASLFPVSFAGVTDARGVAVISNLPVHQRGFEVQHPTYEVPAEEDRYSRWVTTKLASGETTRMTLVLQPKGREFLGDRR